VSVVRRGTVLLLTLGLIVASAVAAYAVFTKQRQVPSNAFTTAADWVAPTTSASVIAKTAGGTAGFIKQGQTYYVYANVTDTGNPPSGVSTVTTNVSSITTGSTAVALVSGSYTIGGVTYGYRTNSITANATLAANTYTYSITATDVGGHSATTNTWSVVVDNTAPSASDVQAVNKAGGIAGRAEIGDTITYTFSETMDPNSILAGWTGASTNVVLRLNDGGVGNDTVTIFDAANSAQLPLGSVNLARIDYTLASVTFGATGTASTMVQSGAAITITLGTQSAAATTAAIPGSMIWTPSATATDRGGNACTTTARTEANPSDKEF
jgi:hypothetical protein